MFAIEKYRVKIHVDKEPGVYEFEPISNTGRSYLCELCKRYHNFGENVAGYDYYDYKLGIPLPQGVDLLVVDRYGLFPFLDDALWEMGEKAIVLVDTKPTRFAMLCAMEASDGDIRVY